MLSLSKSQYIRGLQCPKSLWLHKLNPELRDAVDQGRQAVFDSGTDVGTLAQDLFPGGVEIAFEDGMILPTIDRHPVKRVNSATEVTDDQADESREGNA